MKKVVKREVVDDVTTIQSPRGVSITWLEKLCFEDGTSEIVVREEITFGYHSVKGRFMLLDCGKRH